MNFDSTAMWSESNNNTFEGPGLNIDVAGERMSLGNNFSVDSSGLLSAVNADIEGNITATTGSLGDLDIAGTLEMGPAGDITNAGGDFNIDADGMRLEATPGFNIEPERALTFYDGSSRIGAFYARDEGQLRIEAEPGNNIILNPRLSSNYVQIQNGYFRLPAYFNASRPANPEPGALIYNIDDDRPQFANNAGDWIGVAGN